MTLERNKMQPQKKNVFQHSTWKRFLELRNSFHFVWTLKEMNSSVFLINIRKLYTIIFGFKYIFGLS